MHHVLLIVIASICCCYQHIDATLVVKDALMHGEMELARAKDPLISLADQLTSFFFLNLIVS
jgi:hypothetical protein